MLLAFRPESPAEKEPTAMCESSSTGESRSRMGKPRTSGSLLRRLRHGNAKGSADGFESLIHVCELLELTECRQLRDERAVFLGLGRVLVRQLRDQQLQEGVPAERALTAGEQGRWRIRG